MFSDCPVEGLFTFHKNDPSAELHIEDNFSRSDYFSVFDICNYLSLPVAIVHWKNILRGVALGDIHDRYLSRENGDFPTAFSGRPSGLPKAHWFCSTWPVAFCNRFRGLTLFAFVAQTFIGRFQWHVQNPFDAGRSSFAKINNWKWSRSYYLK